MADRKGKLAIALLTAVIFVFLFLVGPRFLVAPDSLPRHVDVAVVLQGSVAGENARVAGAVALLKLGVASQLVLSVPKESFWGESPIPSAKRYIQTRYGAEADAHLEFCQTDAEVNSTEDEAKALQPCLTQHGWRSIAIVTSDYHTRRSRLIWRKVLRRQYPSAEVWIHGVNDPEFRAEAWWRRRIYAKTTFLEYTKLIWTLITMGPQ
jgi:uncharacterized SAM-binding protein YcdF (DUF218 family)